MRGVPPPERLVKKNTRAAAAQILQDVEFPKEWQAEVSKVESCSIVEYDGGRGLRTIFSKDGDIKTRCNLLCTGDTSKLTMSVELANRY